MTSKSNDLTGVKATGEAIERAFGHIAGNGNGHGPVHPPVELVSPPFTIEDSALELPAIADANDETPKPKPPPPTLKNAVRLLETPAFAGRVWYDQFLRRLMTGEPPREWTDADDFELTIQLQSHPGLFKIGVETVRQAAITVAFRHPRNCVVDWLHSLVWDGTPRIDDFFQDHFGAVNTVYCRAASKNFWLSMVARALQPGCQADNMIVLEGSQGIKKSSALRIIGGDWFTEQHESATGKGFFEILQGKLLIEISEMDSFNRSEVTRVKQVITATFDRFRESYGRHAKDHLRQCVFVATTNKDDWNKDETGARRFWPISCIGDIDTVAIRANRSQFFAESVHRFKQGESWWIMPFEETLSEQQSRYDADPWTDTIHTYVLDRAAVTMQEILIDCLKFDVPKIGMNDKRRVGAVLRILGFKNIVGRMGQHQMRMWRRTS